MHFSNMDIALQLTLWDINIYKSIQPEEIFGQKWSKESTRLLSYNVCRMIQRTNEISQWVATSILIADKSKRIEVFQNMIGIASCLLEIGNFQSFMSIAMAFESIPISRLKLADSVLKKKYQQELAKFQELQSPLNKFRKLREAMNEKSIHIPYLAVVLLDYTAIDENCPQLVEAPTGEKFLNFYKFQQVDRILFQFFATKKLIGPTGLFGNFKLEEQHPLYEFVSVLPGFDTDFLYFLSLSREPKHPNNLN
uniref:Ras-GEF domain-containing protein n=1 Tax=Arcella intermedia TaxID=1963864 RepID=A0A6B2LEJ1_9EUKA